MGGKKKSRSGNSRSSSNSSNKSSNSKRRNNLRSVDEGEDQPVSPKKRNNNDLKSKRKQKNGKGWQSVDAEFKRSLENDGKEIVEMSADGNCLFRSLSDQLFGDYGNTHDHVRWAIVDYMKKNPDNFRHFLVYEDEDDDEQTEEDAKDFPHYLEMMREDGEWGGNLELVAAASLYKRKIIVFQSSMGPALTIDHDGSKSSGPDIMVSYHDNDHYNSVRLITSPPRSSKYARDITMAAQPNGPNVDHGIRGNSSDDDITETDVESNDDESDNAHTKGDEDESEDINEMTTSLSSVNVSLDNCGDFATPSSSTTSAAKPTRRGVMTRKERKEEKRRLKHAERLKKRSGNGGDSDHTTDNEEEEDNGRLKVIQI